MNTEATRARSGGNVQASGEGLEGVQEAYSIGTPRNVRKEPCPRTFVNSLSRRVGAKTARWAAAIGLLFPSHDLPAGRALLVFMYILNHGGIARCIDPTIRLKVLRGTRI